jgi:hypothetical protein
MVCGADLWDVERHVSAGSVQVCAACVDALKQALDQTDAIGEIEVVPAPKVHGPAPDDAAAAMVAQAFGRTFGSRYDALDDYLEDAQELGRLLRDGAGRYGPGVQFNARVDAIRFPRPDLAEVRFQILAGNSPMGYAFQGTASLRDGHWRVTRETVTRILGTVGVTVGHPRYRRLAGDE